MKYENRNDPLVPRRVFFLRILRSACIAGGIIFGSLAIGIAGYHYLEGLAWIDSLLNASMILGGMGPVDALHTSAGKLFASAYALFSGVMFLTIAAVLFAPVIHRLLHHFHIVNEEEG